MLSTAAKRLSKAAVCQCYKCPEEIGLKGFTVGEWYPYGLHYTMRSYGLKKGMFKLDTHEGEKEIPAEVFCFYFRVR